MAMGAAATAAACFSAASSGLSRSRVRAQASSAWAGGAEELVRSGAVRAVRSRDAAGVLSADGFRVLDVRPAWERARAGVRGSAHVPLFVADDDMGPVTLLKKWVHFGYIGLWTGQAFTKMNDRFLDDVAAAVASGGGKDTKLLVACGEGLRSLIAVRMLHDDGYKNLGWLAGGSAGASTATSPTWMGRASCSTPPSGERPTSSCRSCCCCGWLSDAHPWMAMCFLISLMFFLIRLQPASLSLNYTLLHWLAR